MSASFVANQAVPYISMTFAILIVQAALFLPLEYFMAARPSQPHWRRDIIIDLLYYFMASLVIVPLNILCLRFLQSSFHLSSLRTISNPFGLSQLSGAKLAAYYIATIILVDFAQYWVHRALHGARLWKIHSIHHSSPHVDWLSNNRSHPLNYVLLNTLVLDVTIFLGLYPMQSLYVSALYSINSCLVHANLNWTYGPLRYVLVSPVFHRWHHTSLKKGGNKNFATVFSCIDLLFGTFYMPKEEQPQKFGIPDPVPSGFVAQLIYPFIKDERQPARQ